MAVRILHLIPNLRLGGAEAMLSKLVRGLDPARFENRILTISTDNPLESEIQYAGIRVDSLGLSPALPNPWAIVHLARLMNAWRPDVLQTWLYHADLLGTLAAALSPGPSLIWNIRCSDLDMTHHGWRLAAVRHICARLSHRPALVIANAEVGRLAHEAAGYQPRAWSIVPNGFDTAVFKPDPPARARTRARLGVAEETVLIGLVARWDPQKDHETFVRAAQSLARERPDVAFACVGTGLTPDANGSAALLRRHPIDAPVHLLGPRQDLPALYPAFDIATLTSRHGEGFPNVVGEAMACSVPCIVTDVGDSAAIVGASGVVAPPREPSRLASAWRRLIDGGPELRRALGKAARERIQAHYSLESILERYGEIYEREAAAASKAA